jgi:hypothetical protein
VGETWRDCIVTLIDLVGVRSDSKSGRGSVLMRKLQDVVVQEIGSERYGFARAYTYNDAVLLLSYVSDARESFQTAMRDADNLKKQIDRIQASYAIAVKGQAFPLVFKRTSEPRVTVIETSSWAMANCFEIEKTIGKLKKVWYVDGRIAKKIRTKQSSEQHNVKMYPSGRERSVHVYGSYLWTQADV